MGGSERRTIAWRLATEALSRPLLANLVPVYLIWSPFIQKCPRISKMVPEYPKRSPNNLIGPGIPRNVPEFLKMSPNFSKSPRSGVRRAGRGEAVATLVLVD